MPKYIYQYRMYPTSQQKIKLNSWLRICRYWYNKQLRYRLDWWEKNRSLINVCPLIRHLPMLMEKLERKRDLVFVEWSGELVDFSEVPFSALKAVSARVEGAYRSFVTGNNGKYTSKPRFKSASRYRSLVLEGGEGLKLNSCSLNGRYLYLKLPKLDLIKVRTHRPLPDGVILKQAQVIKKADGWYVNLFLEDPTVLASKQGVVTPTWDNSLGVDAVQYGDDFLATSEGEKLPAISLNLSRLSRVRAKKNARKRKSRARRKLAIRESKEHQRVTRSCRDQAYKAAHILLRTGKQVFFHEKLSNRSEPKADRIGAYLPNGQSAKSGLDRHWNGVVYGQFFSILEYIAGKAGAKTVGVNPIYTTQLLCYRNEFVFADHTRRTYFDEGEQLNVDRCINAAINIKRVGLGVFPTIKRCKGKPVVVFSTTKSTSKEVLPVLFRAAEKSISTL